MTIQIRIKISNPKFDLYQKLVEFNRNQPDFIVFNFVFDINGLLIDYFDLLINYFDLLINLFDLFNDLLIEIDQILIEKD